MLINKKKQRPTSFPTKKPSRSEVLTFVALYAIAILTTRAIGRGHFDDLRLGGYA